MADKSFEELVQQELSGLQLNPEAVVWEQIETELRKEKKERWIIWLFLLGILCGSVFLFTYYRPLPSAGSNLAEQNLPKTNETRNQHAITNKKEKIVDSTIIIEGREEAVEQRKGVGGTIPGSRKYIRSNSTGILYKTEQDQPSPIADIKVLLTPLTDTILKAGSAAADTVEQATPAKVLIDKKSIDQKEPVVRAVTTKKTTRQPWQLYGTVDLGMGGIVQTAANKFTAAYLGSVTSGITISSPFNFSANGGIYQHVAPSFGFSAEAVKQTGKRRDIGFSIGYYQLRSATIVGNKTNGTIAIPGIGVTNENGFYYTGANQHPYTNQYHFLQAGFSLYTKYKIHNSFAVRWQLGAAASWLFGSNAVHYDFSQQVSFQNNHLLTPVQGSLLTGLDFALGKQKIIYTGPVFSYYFSGLSNMPGANNEHLFRAGIKASMLLSKKKK